MPLGHWLILAGAVHLVEQLHHFLVGRPGQQGLRCRQSHQQGKTEDENNPQGTDVPAAVDIFVPVHRHKPGKHPLRAPKEPRAQPMADRKNNTPRP